MIDLQSLKNSFCIFCLVSTSKDEVPLLTQKCHFLKIVSEDSGPADRLTQWSAEIPVKNIEKGMFSLLNCRTLIVFL